MQIWKYIIIIIIIISGHENDVDGVGVDGDVLLVLTVPLASSVDGHKIIPVTS